VRNEPSRQKWYDNHLTGVRRVGWYPSK
jgi:hypothetical protein